MYGLIVMVGFKVDANPLAITEYLERAPIAFQRAPFTPLIGLGIKLELAKSSTGADWAYVAALSSPEQLVQWVNQAEHSELARVLDPIKRFSSWLLFELADDVRILEGDDPVSAASHLGN